MSSNFRDSFQRMAIACALYGLFLAFKVQANTVNIDMFAGEVKVLGYYAIDRVAVGNGQMIRVEVKEGGEVILIAQEAGSSSLRLWLKDGEQMDFNVRISENDPQTRVRMENTIRMKVKMVEVRKSALKDLGIDWAKEANGPAFGTAGDWVSSSLFRVDGDNGISETLPLNVRPFSTYFGLASSITSKINFLASSGDAVTLAEPILSCRNGGSAEFLAGGEIPYPVTGANGQVSVEFKEYGIKLNIKPQADHNGNIYTSMLTEISQIDPAVSVLGAPGILTRRTKTEMNLLAGDTIVLSGLLSAESSEDMDKIPGLGDLPLLGRLFQSKNFRNQVTELVIFVTPEVIEPKHNHFTKREQRLYDYSQQRLKRIQDKLDFQLMD